jgi:hypothetical protein
MDTHYSPEDIRKKFESLPEDIKALVYSADMSGVLKAAANKYGLHIDQLDSLEAVTADVMTGFSQREEFVPNLKESLDIDDTKAQAIAKDINEQLFVKIRESMKKASEQSAALKPPVSTPIIPPPAAPKPIATAPAPSAPVPAPIVPSTMPQMPKKPDLSAVDTMLERKNVSAPPPPAAPVPTTPPPGAPQAKPYATDPYREPPTP